MECICRSETSLMTVGFVLTVMIDIIVIIIVVIIVIIIIVIAVFAKSSARAGIRIRRILRNGRIGKPCDFKSDR